MGKYIFGQLLLFPELTDGQNRKSYMEQQVQPFYLCKSSSARNAELVENTVSQGIHADA